MRHVPCFAAAVLAFASLFAAPPAQAETAGHLHLFLGQRSLDSDFEPADDASQFGAALSIGHRDWPLSLAIDVMLASDDGSQATTLGGFPVTGDVDLDINELDLGIRHFTGDGAWRVYFGGGAALVEADFESVIRDDVGPLLTAEGDDSDLGLWLNVGGAWLFGERYSVGLDVRYTDVEVELQDGQTFDAGGVQVGASVGYRW